MATCSQNPHVVTMRVILLISDGFYRIELCSFLGRVPTEEHARKRADGKAHDDAPHLDGNGPVGQCFDGVGRSNAEEYSDDTSGYAQEDGLNEELVEDIDAACTYTHTQSNLSRAFGYAHIHDVHNADAADNE